MSVDIEKERGEFELQAVMAGLNISMFTPPNDKEYRDPFVQARWDGWLSRSMTQIQTDAHKDDIAVNNFSASMREKMAASRAKGRSGWDDLIQCTDQFLADQLIEHLSKGNYGTFEDIANFAMMLHQRGADPIVLAKATPIKLKVWYGSLPESNGKYNWTAILHRSNESFMNGITIDVSEFSDRVLYEADRMRFMIDEISVEPDIMDYDPNLRSWPKEVSQKHES